MPLWDDLPSDIRDSGGLDALEPLLDNVTTPTSSEETDAEGTWRVYRSSFGGSDPLSIDLSSGAVRRGPSPGSNALEFLDPSVDVELALRLTGPGGSPDATVRLIIATPAAALRIPYLRGAFVDAQGQLRADPAHPEVRFLLPALRVRALRTPASGIDVTLLSAATGPAVDHIYDFVRMQPPYALIGPGNVWGFAFRAAVLDLSGTAGPAGVPPEARAMPGDWQGLWLPEVRLFVAPNGLEGLAFSGGVRDMWIGIGAHAGVTGIFEAEIVQRGADPQVRLRFQTPSGEWIGVAGTDPTTPIDLPEETRLYADAGGSLAPFTFSITVDGVTTTSDRADVTTPESGVVNIQVRVTDAAAHMTTRSLSVRRRAAGPGALPAAPDRAVTATTTTTTGSRIVVSAQTTANVTVRLEPPGGNITWSWPGGSATGATAEVPIAAGVTVTVTATRTRAASSVLPVDCYTLFDRPKASEGDAFADNPDRTHTQPANNRTGWGSSPEFLTPDNLARLEQAPPGTTWTVDGFASYEGDNSAGKQDYNRALSERRRDVLMRILERNGFAGRVTAGTAHGHAIAMASTTPAPSDPSWWRASATASLPAPTSETVTATLRRPVAADPTPDVDPRPPAAPVPDCFRKLGARLELIRGTFVRAEIYGEFDVQTAAEQRLAASVPAPPPARNNPQDGICTFLIRLRVAEDRTSWDTTAEFRAIEGDLDGLAKVERRATGDERAIDVLGAVTALAPLLAAATPPSPDEGELVPLVVLASVAVGLGTSGTLQTRYVILRGGELVVSDGLVDPATGTGPRTTQVSILLDLETAFTFDLGFIRVQPDKPIVTRYKAVGVRSTWDTRTDTEGNVEYLPLPVFDPSRGYTLDVPAGSLVAADPLGEILRILGVRVSRDNPTFLEVEVGVGADLGIVQVDTARVRLKLDPPTEPPQLTKLGATIDIPGTVHGSGYVEITPFGFKGAFDMTVVPLNVRGAAFVALETRDGITGMLVGVEVEFPVPLPLGNSGLGLYGFLGGVGVNYGRKEPTGVSVPALRWLEQQLAPSRNSVMHPDGWEHRAGTYAFAAGLLLGTAEGGFVLHLKGIVLIEVPGPRLMLVMKADVLKMPPVLKAQGNATFLAVLDLDFGRGTITIGVVAEYSVVDLLRIRVPVTAFFDTHHVERWFVDLGTFNEPVTVSVLDVFEGTGYLMVHGNGIAHPRLPTVSHGLTIAVGFHFEAILMGSRAVGLYLEAAAGFDALVSFEPFSIGGRVYVRGELRLFIVSIGASAELTVHVGRQLTATGAEIERTYVHGEVCGHVDFFFFSVEGCVSLTIGETPPDAPVAPPLVAGVTLVSRSPALVEGTATDRAVDGKLADAVALPSSDPAPTVPLDAIPAVLFDVAPTIAGGDIVLGGVAFGNSGAAADPWIRRGDRWWRYELTGVELVGPLQPTDGKTPATWWARGLPGDPQHGPALALLNWLPTPTPRAVPYGERLTETVTERWGRICGPVAPAAPVLWTFDGQPIGPSPVGWRLHGVAWPDPAGSYRSSDVDGRLSVIERWRSGHPIADVVQGTEPARVIGDAVPCPDGKIRHVDDLEPWMAGQPTTFSRRAMLNDGAALQDIADLLADDASLADVSEAWSEAAWDPILGREPLECEGRVLRSPVGDDAEPAPDGDDLDREVVRAAWQERAFKPSDLEDSLLLRADAGLRQLTLLLLVPRRAVEHGLVARFRDATGSVLGEQPIDGSGIVTASRPVPTRWTDPSGPWADPVERTGRIAARIATATPGLLLVLVEGDIPEDTVEVELGWDRSAFQDRSAPAFYVVAAEGLATTEEYRASWDSSTLDREREVLETALTQDPDDHALLVPGQTYTVRVHWRGESVQQDDKPPSSAPPNFGPVQTQEFRFAADPASEAPANLAPWILASAPSMDETGVLCREPVRIALATQNVAALFAAYGEELRVVLRSASGRHPAPPADAGGGAAGDPVTIPVGAGGVVHAAPAGLVVTTPWEQAVSELVATLECIPEFGSRTHHDVIELAYDLEPLTDYLLDVVAVPAGSPSTTSGRRVHRVGFTTSRFGTVTDLADLVRASVVEHRLVATPTEIAGLPERPTGDVLDRAFQRAGLGVPQVPRYPRVQVLWSPDSVPQPVAVVVECSESMWRERPMPTLVTGPIDASDPAHQWWAAVPTDWLSLQDSAAAVAAGDPPRAPVTRLVRAPGGTRAVAILGASARGTEIRIDLVVAGDALAGTAATRAEAVRVALLRAPWEVED